MENKLRGRPLKRDEDKLIGRRISIVQARWDIFDRFCDMHDITLEHLMCDVTGILSDMMDREVGL